MTDCQLHSKHSDRRVRRGMRWVLLASVLFVFLIRGCSIPQYQVGWRIHTTFVEAGTHIPILGPKVKARLVHDEPSFGQYQYVEYLNTTGLVSIFVVEAQSGAPGGVSLCGGGDPIPPEPTSPIPNQVELLIQTRDAIATVTVPVTAASFVGYEFARDVPIVGILEFPLIELVLTSRPEFESYRSGNETDHMLAADINGDGRLDLVTATFHYANNISAIYNDGTGKFGASPTTISSRPASAVVSGDIDSDSDIDIVVFNSPHTDVEGVTSPAQLTLLLNDGDGTDFTPRSVTIDPQDSGKLALVDLNSDGHLDLVIGSNNYLNDGQAQFTRAADLPFNSYDFAFGDLDGDSHVDLVSIEHLPFPDYDAILNVAIKGDSGAFLPELAIPLNGVRAWRLYLADIDNDNDLDVACLINPPDGSTEKIMIFLNSGDGILDATSPLWVGDNVADLFIVDVDGDGDRDIIALSYGAPFNIVITPNIGGGEFGPYHSDSLGYAADQLIVTDLDGTGNLDWAGSSRYNARIYIRLNPMLP